jgi:hypothetical protein
MFACTWHGKIIFTGVVHGRLIFCPIVFRFAGNGITHGNSTYLCTTYLGGEKRSPSPKKDLQTTTVTAKVSQETRRILETASGAKLVSTAISFVKQGSAAVREMRGV